MKEIDKELIILLDSYRLKALHLKVEHIASFLLVLRRRYQWGNVSEAITRQLLLNEMKVIAAMTIYPKGRKDQ